MENHSSNEKAKTASSPVPMTAPGSDINAIKASTSPAFLNKPSMTTSVVDSTSQTVETAENSTSHVPTVISPAKKGSSKAIISLVACLSTVAIAAAIILTKQEDEVIYDPELLMNASLSNTDSSVTPSSSIPETTVSESKVIAHFVGKELNNEGWVKRDEELTEVVNNSHLRGTRLRSREQEMSPNDNHFEVDKPRPTYTGIKFPIDSNAKELFEKGWRLTYRILPGRGIHRLGFIISEENNPGWQGGDVAFMLVVRSNLERTRIFSPLNNDYKINPDNFIPMLKSAKEKPILIEIEQAPNTVSGEFTVKVNRKLSYTGHFLKGVEFEEDSYWGGHLFSSLRDTKSDADWVIKELKLETF